MNTLMEAMAVLAEIESLKKTGRDPRAFSLDAVRSGPGEVKVKELFGKYKLHTGKNLTPKQKAKNLKTLHDLHRAAADANRNRAAEVEKATKPKTPGRKYGPGRGSGDLHHYTTQVGFHTDKADKLRAKLLKAQ
jgi:hypothetical protein